MKTAEQLLREFCADYLAWVRGGAQAGHPIFRRDAGLCWCMWAWTQGLADFSKLDYALFEAFRAAELNTTFPFNADHIAFYAEVTAGEGHLNPARLAFVERHAK